MYHLRAHRQTASYTCEASDSVRRPHRRMALAAVGGGTISLTALGGNGDTCPAGASPGNGGGGASAEPTCATALAFASAM